MRVRFPINQVGLAIEYYAHGAWRCAGLYNHEQIKNHGGVALLKTKLLYAIYPAANMQMDIVPAGDYREDDCTITCV